MAKRKRSLLRRMLGFGLVAGAGYAVWRAIEANQRATDWRPQPFPFPPEPRSGETDTGSAPEAMPPD